MPRNIAGVYTLPLPPVNPGDVVESAWANDTLDDIALALTDSLSRTGQGGMTGAFKLADGTEAAPGLAFENQPGTGMWREPPGIIHLSIIGSDVLEISPTDLTLPSLERLRAPFDGTTYITSSIVNSNVVLPLLPNGTGEFSAFVAFDGSDPANSATLTMAINGGAGVELAYLDVSKSGTGVVPPFSIRHDSNTMFYALDADKLGWRVIPATGQKAGKTVMDFCHNGTGVSATLADAGYTFTIQSNAIEDDSFWRFAHAGNATVFNFAMNHFGFYRSQAGGGAAGDVISWNPVITSTVNGNILMDPPATACTLSVQGIHANNAVTGVDQFALKVYGTYGGGLAIQDSGACWGAWCSGGLMHMGVTHAGGSAALAPVIRWQLNAGAPQFCVYNLASTGAGIWYDGSATQGRAFLGMEAGTDTVFRLYGAPGATNVWMSQLNGSGTSFTGTVSAGAFNVTSSRALKENIRPFTRGALARVLAWDLQEFDYIGEHAPKAQAGLIAEDADARISDGTTVNTAKALWEIAAAVQELARKVH